MRFMDFSSIHHIIITWGIDPCNFEATAEITFPIEPSPVNIACN